MFFGSPFKKELLSHPYHALIPGTAKAWDRHKHYRHIAANEIGSRAVQLQQKRAQHN